MLLLMLPCLRNYSMNTSRRYYVTEVMLWKLCNQTATSQKSSIVPIVYNIIYIQGTHSISKTKFPVFP